MVKTISKHEHTKRALRSRFHRFHASTSTLQLEYRQTIPLSRYLCVRYFIQAISNFVNEGRPRLGGSGGTAPGRSFSIFPSQRHGLKVACPGNLMQRHFAVSGVALSRVRARLYISFCTNKFI